ncbi:intersectin-EH binding protein Ibp1 [Mycobacterium sp. MAA66]|uniref:intersectin-EH binding protein Ibp1 n=1 Tax=Mycobacterium sp. MAA66 TaxID=3156297 RepID=UPI003512D4D8
MTTSRTGRILVTGGFALASLAAPVAIAFGTSPAAFVADCPAGMISDPISGSCSSQPQNQVHVQAPGNGLGSVDGIPCTGHNMGQCIGLSENGH